MSINRLQLKDPIFQGIIDALPVLLFWCNTDHIIVGNNAHHARNYGASNSSDIEGVSMRELGKILKLDTALIDLWHEEHDEIIRTKKGKIIEYASLAPSRTGEPIPFLCHKEPLFDENNDVIGVVGVSMDISELKNTQIALVAEKEKAERASRVKSEFIANMSHDLRTPITGIIGAVQELINTADNAKERLDKPSSKNLTQKQMADMLRNLAETIEHDGDMLLGSADQLLRLCNEILETIRLDSGATRAKSEPFDIHQLILSNIDLLQPIAQHRELTLSADISSDVPKYVCGLRTYLDRTLLNLISNGLKFTDRGFVNVSVALIDTSQKKKTKVGDKITLKIIISDTGVGIAKDKFDIVFEHFSRLTSSYEGNYKGSGLGLYTVKHYVEAMQGTMDLESEEGKGTKFTLTLPFEISDHSVRQHQSIRIPESLKNKKGTVKNKTNGYQPVDDNPQSEKHKILVVEDNMAASMAIRVALDAFNSAVDFAEDGKTAVKKVKTNDYDLVLMDIGLPDFSGIEATQQIRMLSDNKKSQVPIVALTGHAPAEARKECEEAGMQDVLIKPARPVALEDIYDRFVNNNEQESSQFYNTKSQVKHESCSEVIDWETSLSMLSGDEKIFRSVFTEFIKDLKLAQVRLDESMKSKDFETLRAELHRCLGGIVYFRLPQLEQSLRDFQASIKSEPVDKEWMDKTYNNLQEAIKTFWQVLEESEF